MEIVTRLKAMSNLEKGEALVGKSFEEQIEYEHQIFKEFQFADWKLYQAERIKVLEKFNEN